MPGAWFAAALFAVHPVEVESVAWVTERKNVLSLALALGSLLCYLRYAPPPRVSAQIASPSGENRWRWYAAALVLFALALFAKTVVVTLPAVILVIQWWQNGRLNRRDWIRVAPLFALSVALGLMTVWMEVYHLGTHGKQFALAPVERFLLAGRTLWFYAGKLAWPQPLAFFYPRWTIDIRAGWQFLFPVSALALLAALWLSRARLGRGPLAAVLIYAGILAPMLGFFNIYFTLYAYVSDHFQYHASVALFALVGTAAERFVRRLNAAAGQIAFVLAGAILVALALLSFRQTLIYHDLETLYHDTIAKNPRGTIAYANLAVHLGSLGQHEESVRLTRKVLELDPDDPIAQANLGYFLLNAGSRTGFSAGQLEEARDALQRALALARDEWGTVPNEPRLRNSLGFALLQLGRRDGFEPGQRDQAIAHLAEAARLDPAAVEPRINLALGYALAQRPADAVESAAQALALDADEDHLREQFGADLVAEAHSALATRMAANRQFAAAADHFRRAVELRPDARALNNLAVSLMNLGQVEDAIRHFEEAVRRDPDYAEARTNLDKARQLKSGTPQPQLPE